MNDRTRALPVPHLLAAIAAIGFTAFLVASMTARGATAGTGTVSAHKTSLGVVLVNAKGRTLYLFAKDTRAHSACSGSCATYWPPVIVAGKPTAGSGVKAPLLGTIMRSGGKHQVTYAGHPLYTFAGDTRSGMTTGEGSSAFGAKWWALSTRGVAVHLTAKPTTTAATTTSPYGGY